MRTWGKKLDDSVETGSEAMSADSGEEKHV